MDVNSADSWPNGADDVAEGYPANWFVREGSTVGAGETLCEIQVKKMSINVAASMAGTVAEIVVTEGDDFACGDMFARVQPNA